jgi:hypothetical protein
VVGGIRVHHKIGVLFVFSEDLYLFDFQAIAFEVDIIDTVMMSPGIANFVSR